MRFVLFSPGFPGGIFFQKLGFVKKNRGFLFFLTKVENIKLDSAKEFC